MVITLPLIFLSVLKESNQLEVQSWLEVFIVVAAALWMYSLLYVTLLQKLKPSSPSRYTCPFFCVWLGEEKPLGVGINERYIHFVFTLKLKKTKSLKNFIGNLNRKTPAKGEKTK